MLDITRYADNELINILINDEYFYSEINNHEFILALVAEEFIYTQDQLDTLKEYLEESAEE